MNFKWSADEAKLRERLRAMLKRELPADWEEISRHGPASAQQTAFSLEFCPKLAAEGLLVPHWPKRWGGNDAPTWEHFILGEELWAAGEPRGAQYMNINYLGPTIMRYGTPWQQERYLPEMASGQAIWCQGFSEPSAGSDLASLRTQARQQGGDYVINGSKVWTSYAGLARQCFLLARVDGAQGKNGIGIFLVPMDTPGIEVRPIPSLVGEGDIHEVFFTDVVVQAEARLGAETEAWSIVRYALSLERTGIARYEFARRVLDRMVAKLQRGGRFDDALVKMKAGQAMAACEAARGLVYRVIDQRARGLPPSADTSLARVAIVTAENAVADFALDELRDDLSGAAEPVFLHHHERAITAGVAGGAAEIQLNLIASDWLDLPREVRA